jgi:hypothetical protein
MIVMKEGLVKNCSHLEDLRGIPGVGFHCPACDAWLNVERVRDWVRSAERARDEAYPVVKGDRFGEIRLDELQREVFRRRKVMYEVQHASQEPIKPEMVLIVHDGNSETYRCRIFYKEPRPVSGIEKLNVEAHADAIGGFRSSQDPIVRLVAEKTHDFHGLRLEMSEVGEPAPARRVYYANEL